MPLGQYELLRAQAPFRIPQNELHHIIADATESGACDADSMACLAHFLYEICGEEAIAEDFFLRALEMEPELPAALAG